MREMVFETPEDARKRLPNLLGILAEANLKVHGEYRCMVDGEKTVIKLEVANGC